MADPIQLIKPRPTPQPDPLKSLETSVDSGSVNTAASSYQLSIAKPGKKGLRPVVPPELFRTFPYIGPPCNHHPGFSTEIVLESGVKVTLSFSEMVGESTISDRSGRSVMMGYSVGF